MNAASSSRTSGGETVVKRRECVSRQGDGVSVVALQYTMATVSVQTNRATSLWRIPLATDNKKKLL